MTKKIGYIIDSMKIFKHNIDSDNPNAKVSVKEVITNINVWSNALHQIIK